MLRVVLDTNVVVSGMLWGGAPREILKLASAHTIQAVVSEAMLDELSDVLHREKFVRRLQLIEKTAEQVISDYTAFTEIVEVQPLTQVVSSDPDDDVFIACAISGRAFVVISGDWHLLKLSRIDPRTVSPTEFLDRLDIYQEMTSGLP